MKLILENSKMSFMEASNGFEPLCVPLQSIAYPLSHNAVTAIKLTKIIKITKYFQAYLSTRTYVLIEVYDILTFNTNKKR